MESKEDGKRKLKEKSDRSQWKFKLREQGAVVGLGIVRRLQELRGLLKGREGRKEGIFWNGAV